MRKALVVGIDYYKGAHSLHGCVNDAVSVEGVLARHGEGEVNFDVVSLFGTDKSHSVRREQLRAAIEELFRGDPEIALLYFAGHGHIDAVGGYLLASDAKQGHEGVSLADVVNWAHQSRAKNRVIILDACHAGIAASPPAASNMAQLTEGMTILTASTSDQYASEENGSGVFTTLLVDALSGSAANLLGDITPGSVYAHVDQSLSMWEQRPVFKTNVKSFVSLRRVRPPIALADLQRITEFFPSRGVAFALDPSFEPEDAGRPAGAPPADADHARTFAVLQQYNRLNLVVPVGAPSMWHAAMGRTSCRLTPLGEHYRRLRERNRI